MNNNSNAFYQTSPREAEGVAVTVAFKSLFKRDMGDATDKKYVTAVTSKGSTFILEDSKELRESLGKPVLVEKRNGFTLFLGVIEESEEV